MTLIPLQFEQYRCSYVDSTTQQTYTQRLSLMDRPNPAAEEHHRKWLLQVKADEQRRQQRLQQWRLDDNELQHARIV